MIEELGKADASTAWCINQRGVFATYASCLRPDITKRVWIDTPRSVVANTPAPDATAVRVEVGYRVSGRMGFSTGCRHVSWLAAGLVTPDSVVLALLAFFHIYRLTELPNGSLAAGDPGPQPPPESQSARLIWQR